MNLSEEKVKAGIILNYGISTFASGFVMGKLTGAKKFLWGILTGVLYFILLLLISLGLYHSLQADTMNLATTFLLCAGGGMLGGMVSQGPDRRPHAHSSCWCAPVSHFVLRLLMRAAVTSSTRTHGQENAAYMQA